MFSMDDGIVAEAGEGSSILYSTVRLSPRADTPPSPRDHGPIRVSGINFDSLVARLHEINCPAEQWVHIRAVADVEGEIIEADWAEEPFEEEAKLRRSMVPEEMRDAFTTLRPIDDLEPGEGYEHTESGLYSRERYLTFEGSKPERFEREPHLEITDIKLGRNFSLPVGCLVRDARTGDKYICAVNPNWATRSVVFAEGFESAPSIEGWDFEDKP